MIRMRIGGHIAASRIRIFVTPSVCSWEPTANVQQCDRLLASFWKHVGTDDNDYAIGYEVAAEEDWISPCLITLFLPHSQSFTDKEKRYFEQTFVKPPKRKSDKATKKDRQVGETST